MMPSPCPLRQERPLPEGEGSTATILADGALYGLTEEEIAIVEA